MAPVVGIHGRGTVGADTQALVHGAARRSRHRVQSRRRRLGEQFGSEGTAGGSIYNNGVWLTSNSTLSVTRLELSATYSNAVQSILMGQYDPTDLSVIVATTDACYWYDVCYMDY